MKNLVPILLMFCLLGRLSAQNSSTAPVSNSKFHPTIKISPALGWFNNEATQDFKARCKIERDGFAFGLNYGLMLDYMFTDNYGLSFELRYMNMWGGGYNTEEHVGNLEGRTINKTNISFNTNYLEIPVSFKMMTNEIGYLKYFAQVGATLSILTRGRMDRTSIDYDSFGVPKSPKIEVDYKSSPVLRPFDTYLSIGGGVEYNLSGNTSLTSNITYNSGLFDLNKSEKFTSKRRYFALNIGIKF